MSAKTDGSGGRLLEGEELRVFWADLHQKAIAPHASQIAQIVAVGRIAVLVHKPALKEVRELLEALGWRKRPVFGVKPELLHGLIGLADPVTYRWAARRDAPGTGRVFLIVEAGTFLLNAGPGGLSQEPGSSDTALATAAKERGN